MERTVLVKAFALLESLGRSGDGGGGAAGGDGVPLRDLARRAQLKRPTAHRILGTLARLGYVQNRGDGVYRMTAAAAPWAGPVALAGADRMVALARPVLDRLQRLTTETVNLGVLRGDRVEYLLVVESTHPLRRVVAAGDTDPWHTTALGRAIVAHLPAARREALVSRVARGNEMRLRRMLARVARAGHAVERDETDVGVTCIGAPVFAGDAVVAAVSVSAPTARATPQRRRRWLAALAKAAVELSERTSLKQTR